MDSFEIELIVRETLYIKNFITLSNTCKGHIPKLKKGGLSGTERILKRVIPR